MTEEQKDFARAFGDALLAFLQKNGWSQAQVANRLGLGKKGKARINTYCHDSPKGTRAKPSAEVLYWVCVELGFEFEYSGHKISAATLNGHRAQPIEAPALQLPLEFQGQFDLTDQRGHQATVSVRFRRPSGEVEVSINLKAAS
jgi:transcriptional regulator with XRE-family HTH domain